MYPVIFIYLGTSTVFNGGRTNHRGSILEGPSAVLYTPACVAGANLIKFLIRNLILQPLQRIQPYTVLLLDVMYTMYTPATRLNTIHPHGPLHIIYNSSMGPTAKFAVSYAQWRNYYIVEEACPYLLWLLHSGATIEWSADQLRWQQQRRQAARSCAGLPRCNCCSHTKRSRSRRQSETDRHHISQFILAFIWGAVNTK